MDDKRPDAYLHFDQVSLESCKTQAECEVALAKAILWNPETGIDAAEGVGLRAEHFQVHNDMRVIYVACALAWERGREFLLQFIPKALKAEDEYALLEYGWDRFTKPKELNPYLLHVGVQLVGRQLIDIYVRQRAAVEHVRHACRILKGQVAA
jgi:hypothetical protein